MEYILEAKDVTKRYENFTLNSINMKIPYGKIVGLIGENGAGKTTFISIILNQISYNKGIIKLFGMDSIKNDIECKKSIGFVVDECCFHKCLNAYNISSIMCNIYTEWDELKFMSFLSQFNVDPKKKIKDFSKGMKSKLMLAVALSHNSKFLILDEITSGLDPIIRDDILLVLKDYVSKTNASVLFSTHITSDLDKIADEIVFLHKGNLIFHETTQALREQYKLIRCSEKRYNTLPKENIQKVLFRENEYFVLLHGDIEDSFRSLVSIPSIDDVMLLHIKGEDVL